MRHSFKSNKWYYATLEDYMRQTSKQVTLTHLKKELEYRLNRDDEFRADYLLSQNQYAVGTSEHTFNMAMRNYHDGKVHAYQHALNLIEDELGYI